MRHARSQSAVTLIGLLVALGLFVSILCGLLYVGAKLLHAGQTIQARHEAALTNIDKMTIRGEVDRDPVITALLALPEVVLAPPQDEMSDRAFLKWAGSCRDWAILYRQTLADPWTDTGNRLYGASEDVTALLRQWCAYEAVYTAVGATKDGLVRETGFYGFCAVEDVPVKPPDK